MTKTLRKIEDLTGNECLAKSILSDDLQMLLAEGTVLREEYIEKLKELHIKEVYVWEETDTQTAPLIQEEVAEAAHNKVRDILEKHTYSHNEDLMEICQTADRIISNILEEEEVLKNIYEIRERSFDIYDHSISICSMAIIVALRMKLDQGLVHDIGVGCLLHDIGLRYLTIDYENQDIEELTEAEAAEYKKHPVYGYSALRGEDWISAASKNMILYHHERLDGSGYPLRATDISLESRIIQVCDAFDEMICGLGCKRQKVYEAIEYLKDFKNSKFDGTIVDTFLEFIAVYPIGTHVRTNEGEEGIVVGQNKEFPERPVLHIIKNAAGKETDVIKNLIEIRNIYIETVL